MFNSDETIDSLIDVADVTDQKAMEISPEPESMLDSVFNEMETPEEEYKRVCKILEPQKEIAIDAYGTKLFVFEHGGEVQATGDITLNPRNNAALGGFEECYISIWRSWEPQDDGTVKVVDRYSLRLNLHRMNNNDSVEYHTDSEKNNLSQAFETLLQMRDCMKDHRPLEEKLKGHKRWAG